jgi:3-hydroxybutyryl-CoA dehydrogenase
MVAKGTLSAPDREAALGRVRTVLDLEELSGADLVIEAAAEDMESKRALFADLDRLCRREAVLATNTSSLPIGALGAATTRPDKVLGVHFFNPVPAMALVEIVRSLDTSEESCQAMAELVRSLGKTPVVVNESPGFVVNRLLVPMINEAVSVLAEGLAPAEDIDEAMRLGANHPMGPLALADLIGLDVILAVMEVLQAELGEDKYRPHPHLRRMVRSGRLGRKSGRGFFDYSQP